MGVKYLEYNNLAAACFSHATNLKIYKLKTGKIKEYKFENLVDTPLALVRNLFSTNFMFLLAPSHCVLVIVDVMSCCSRPPPVQHHPPPSAVPPSGGGGSGGGLFSSIKGGAGSFFKGLKDTSSKVVQSVQQ